MKLIPPTRAVAFFKTITSYNTFVVTNTVGKYHLLKRQPEDSLGQRTACGMTIWNSTSADLLDFQPTEKLKADQVCLKCLGAMEAKDE